MTVLSLSSQSLPALQGMLTTLSLCLEKAATDAAARKFNPDVLLQSRLAPDMLPFASQVRIACDTAKYGAARLAGVEAPRHEDTEATLADLQARIASTQAFLAGVPAAAIDASVGRDITFPVGRERTPKTLEAAAYLNQWVLPNFYFHIVTAYALLRHNGVPIGKSDYLSGVLTPTQA
jgi:hypothetical protein